MICVCMKPLGHTCDVCVVVVIVVCGGISSLFFRVFIYSVVVFAKNVVVNGVVLLLYKEGIVVRTHRCVEATNTMLENEKGNRLWVENDFRSSFVDNLRLKIRN